MQVSQNPFSERLDVDQATVSRWERGFTEPQYEMRKILHEMAGDAGLATLGDLTNIVNFSPFPMILVDRCQEVYAASMSSGFKTNQSVTDQTPLEEQAFLQNFIGQLEAAGFWEGDCPKFVTVQSPLPFPGNTAILVAISTDRMPMLPRGVNGFSWINYF